MKRFLISVFLVLLVASTACAWGPMVMFSHRTMTYLINEGFESGTEPTGWTHGAPNNYGYSAAPLDGTYSLQTGSYGGAATPAVVGDTLYVTAHFKIGTFSDGTVQTLAIYGSSNTIVAQLVVGPTGKVGAVATGGTLVYSADGVVALNTPVYLKMMYTKGTGANATATVWTSSNGTTWTQRATSTNGTSTGQSKWIALGTGAVNILYWDTVKASYSNITDARSGF